MDKTYLLLKCLHIAGVVIFLGNILVTAWWKTHADRTRNPVIIAFAQRQVTLTDFVFTAGGAVLLGVAGVGNATLHGMNYLQINWLAWGYGLFLSSGVIWVAVLIPIQIRQAKIARTFASGGEIPQTYWKLGKIWLLFGVLATVIPFASIYWMVFKPT